MKPIGIARRIVTAHQDKRSRHFLFDALRQTNRPFAFGREITLQADNIGPERLADRHSVFRAVDSEIDDLAFVPVTFQAGRDTDRPERLNKREHLKPKDAADGRLDKGDLQ